MTGCHWMVLLLSFPTILVGAEDPLDWWQTTVIYQVYPRSFQDSDGDGTGDLRGIIHRMEYFKDSGINTIWISPFYDSPNVDFGYDISNFTHIDPLFGTIEIFNELQSRCKELGINLLIDLVPNHTSNESVWFKNSVQKIEPYTDYYIWVDPKYDENGTRLPPNNWVSIFLGTAWEWREERQQYYLHQFAVQQPDLNFRNPLVVEEFKAVMRYWLEEGVDGFRMDAVPFLFEDEQLRDEELAGDISAQSTSEEYPDRYHTQNLPESVEMVQQWRQLVDQYTARDNRTRLMVTEAYAKVDKTFQYYGTEERPGAHFTFNFFLIQMLGRSSGAAAFSRTIGAWLQNLPEGRWCNWVIGNHDNGRVASRFPGLADAMSALVLWLPGTAVTYYGDEIAMEDGPISYEDTIDPLGRAAGPQGYLSLSRDPARTPFQWDDSASAGFSSSETTWLPVHPNYKQLNLARQKQSDDSHYRVYTKLVAERRARTLQRGSTTVDALSDNVLAFARELAGDDTYCVVINMGNSSETVDLTAAFRNIPSRLSVVVASAGSSFARGSVVSSTAITLAEKEFVGLKSSSELCDTNMPFLVKLTLSFLGYHNL